MHLFPTCCYQLYLLEIELKRWACRQVTQFEWYNHTNTLRQPNHPSTMNLPTNVNRKEQQSHKQDWDSHNCDFDTWVPHIFVMATEEESTGHTPTGWNFIKHSSKDVWFDSHDVVGRGELLHATMTTDTCITSTLTFRAMSSWKIFQRSHVVVLVVIVFNVHKYSFVNSASFYEKTSSKTKRSRNDLEPSVQRRGFGNKEIR